MRLIDRWWRVFADESKSLAASLDGPEAQLFAERIQERLAQIDSRLCWEIGPGAAGKPHRLVITPETDMDLRPLTQTLLERAPEIPGWEFYSHRLAESPDMLPYTLQHRAGRAPHDLKAFVEVAGPRKLAVRFVSSEFSEAEDDEPAESDCAVAFVAAETLLGEEFVDQWIAFVGVEAADPEERNAYELLFGRPMPREGLSPEELREACWKAALALREKSPELPFFQRIESLAWERVDVPSDGHALAALLAEEGAEPIEAVDLLDARTLDLELWTAFQEPLFFSASWSRAGETFCRLKLSASAPGCGLELDRLARELDSALKAESLGCVIAVGAGERFGYLDVALVSLPAATRMIQAWGRQSVAGSCIGVDSWLLFHDAYLSGEWIGLADATTAPHGME
ncbi:MAG TPA: hypothetical protein VGN57_11900 [Pirellulaceae bacterium]|nr:hypothetical protein [Pirellulaceae bacterium]